MKKEDVFRIALKCFNMSYDKIGADSVEASYCEDFLRSAELFCARTYKWSFLQKRLKYEEADRIDEAPFRNMKYCYRAPDDIVQMVFINCEYNSDFQIIGRKLYTRECDPEITYLSGEVDYDSFPYPDDYGYMLAYRLAMEISQYIAPDNSVASENAQQKFLLCAQVLQNSEVDMQRKRNPHPSQFVY